MPSTKQKLRLAGAFAALATLALAVSCKGFFVNPTLTAIGITPATPTITDIPPNNTQQFSVIGTFSDGSSGSTPVTWSSDTATTVAKISGSGLATAVGVGSASITATSTILPTITASTSLTVVPGDVTSIVVTPSSQSVPSTGTFFLLAKDQSGNDISSSVTWTFEQQGTTTIESGLTQGTATTQGIPFTIGTLSPTPAPVTLSAFATLTVNGTTVTSNIVTVGIT